jgi:hypothetical protein
MLDGVDKHHEILIKTWRKAVGSEIAAMSGPLCAGAGDVKNFRMAIYSNG